MGSEMCIRDSNNTNTSVDTLKFTMAAAFPASETVDLSTTGTVITYLDENQGINCENPQSFDGDANTAECSWSSSWLIGSGDIVDLGEQVEVGIILTALTTLLAAKKEFSGQVKPNKGAAVIVNRTMPGERRELWSLSSSTLVKYSGTHQLAI